MPTPSSIAARPSILLAALGAFALMLAVVFFAGHLALAQTPTNQSATGRPVVLASAEGAPYLFADTSDIRDGNGLPFSGTESSVIEFTYSYQWVRVDGGTETDIGADSPRYHLVDDDIGKLIKVQVSFTDDDNFAESVTSLPFGPVSRAANPSLSPSTLVSNTGQSEAGVDQFGQQYAMGFRLGDHGQGYELSSVSIELGGAPSGLTVSLWIGGSVPESKLYDFASPATLESSETRPEIPESGLEFTFGRHRFTAPAGVLLYQNVNYYIVLSDFGRSLGIWETTSDDEDPGGEQGAVLFNQAKVRALGSTGRWGDSADHDSSGVLRLAVEGSRRASGILVSTYAQPFVGDQETISIGDECCVKMDVGAADRYLIRGFSWVSDSLTDQNGGITNPFYLREDETKLFKLINTRNEPGITEWTAPPGATVAGGSSKTYIFGYDFNFPEHLTDGTRVSAILTRIFSTPTGHTGTDTPSVPGMALRQHGDIAVEQPLMAVLGEPLDAMVSNLGQADNGYVTLGDTSKVLAQRFTTGANAAGYRLQGIGFNIEGSQGRVPDGPTSVSVAVHADSGGQPGDKLFDLVSPGEYAAGHSFFEAPPGKTLQPGSYVVVWSHLTGTSHRLRRTSSDSEDSGGLTGFSVANALYSGADTDNLSADSGSNALEIVVYGSAPATGRPTVIRSEAIAGALLADTSGIRDADGLPASYSYQWIRVAGGNETDIGVDSSRYQLVDADIGHRIKVRVWFIDDSATLEILTSRSFGPVAESDLQKSPSLRLVSNTGQSPSATATITWQYAQGFRLGSHVQSYEISSVLIDLAAPPSDLTVSLWIGGLHGAGSSRGVSNAQRELFKFNNPASFRAGLNEFTAPAGAFAYPNVYYFIVLSDFGPSLQIKETTSDAEDPGGQGGARIINSAHVRPPGSTGRWSSYNSRGGVVRLAVKGSRQVRGVLASTYGGEIGGGMQAQETVSLGDNCCFDMTVGPADRYLIRGVSVAASDSTKRGGFFGHPFDLQAGSDTLFSLAYASAQGDLADAPLHLTSPAGISEWTAPQGATVAGSSEYTFHMDIEEIAGDTPGTSRGGVILSQISCMVGDDYTDPSSAPGVTFSDHGDVACPTPAMAVLGEPLDAMVSNLTQTNDGYVNLGGAAANVATQGFTTGGASASGYRLQGIGVNIIRFSSVDTHMPDGPTSVSVAVHADANGKPGNKLFDLASPAEFSAYANIFFEAPARTVLEPNTSYVLVWHYLGGTQHRLRKTSSDSEDSGGLTGFRIANALYSGANLGSLSADSGSNALEIAVYGSTANNPATGRPTVVRSQALAGSLRADASGIADADGLSDSPFYTYQWFRVDGGTETSIGVNSNTYRLVASDIGHRIEVRVSFTDDGGNPESLTSLPFGPVAESDLVVSPSSRLVSNTGQSPSATATITQQYALGFRLGAYGQGYEISSVSIDLAAAPSSLTVSLWIGAPAVYSGVAAFKLFDFENPSSFRAGLNKFTAPPGGFTYPNVYYFIVLSGFGSSLSIKETTSDAEDPGRETGARIRNEAKVRALGTTGQWRRQYEVPTDSTSMEIAALPTSRDSVLRLAVAGSKRDRGILASNYAQTWNAHEALAAGDEVGMPIGLGVSDRYLIRGFSWLSDNSTTRSGGICPPFDLRSGHTIDDTQAITKAGTKLFGLTPKRGTANSIAGINEWTAPRGATVPGGSSYLIYADLDYLADIATKDYPCPSTNTLLRVFGTDSDDDDTPTAPGVSLSDGVGDFAGRPLMAVLGEPLEATVQNLGQSNNGHANLGSDYKVLSQGFTTGSDPLGYRLQGIGVNIEGSDDNIPDGPASVSVAVHADAGGKPGAKLFDLVSPTEFAAGHSFFEAPPGTVLYPNTSYVLVWWYVGGSWHRLQRTTSDSEDSGGLTGFSIANAYHRGQDRGSLSEDSGSGALEMAVYGVVRTRAPFVPGGIPVTRSWLHTPEGADVGYQFRLLFVTHHGMLPTSGEIEDYNTLVQEEAAGTLARGKTAPLPYTDPVIQKVASQFKAVACTAAVGARENTGMPTDAIGVPVHWLDGGLEDHPTLVANSYAEFYGPTWVNTDYGAKVTGNSTHFEDYEMVLTGCDASGAAHPDFPLGAASDMDDKYMVAVGTPKGRSLKTREDGKDPNFAPLGAVDVAMGYAYYKYYVVIGGEKQKRLLPLYAISPIFTVVAETEGE